MKKKIETTDAIVYLELRVPPESVANFIGDWEYIRDGLTSNATVIKAEVVVPPTPNTRILNLMERNY